MVKDESGPEGRADVRVLLGRWRAQFADEAKRAARLA